MYLSLQACRAVAALLVVLFHLGGTFAQDKYFGFKAIDSVFAWGDAGVDFFFVLSGFLITIVHRRDFGHPAALTRYAIKRTLRIYPTYWLVCAAVCAAALVVPALRQALPVQASTFVKALLLIPQDPDLVGGLGSPILFVAWSLQYEMLFYLVAGLAIANRAAGWAVAAALLGLNLGCQFGSACTFPVSFIGNNMIYLFAMGVLAAFVVRSDLRLPWPAGWAGLAALGFVGLGAFESVFGRATLGIDRRLAFGALAAVMVVALARAEDTGRLRMRQRWIALLGASSYALYLVHIPVISLLVKVLASRHLASHALLLVAYAGVALACVGAAVVFHLLVERPMLEWMQRLAGRFGARSPAVRGPDRSGSVHGMTGAPRANGASYVASLDGTRPDARQR